MTRITHLSRSGRWPVLKWIVVCSCLLSLLCGRDTEAWGQQRRRPKFGLLLNTPMATPGYTLLAPTSSRKTFLINLDGKIVHTWEAEAKPGNSAYLLDNGDLLRCSRIEETYGFLTQGGVGGRIQRFDWDGNVLWDYYYADQLKMHHHDICLMPNGNILLIAWERKTREQALAAGRAPEFLEGDELWPESIVEVKPTGKSGGEIVWMWKLWDHLIQDQSDKLPNFGDPRDNPELVDINCCSHKRADWIHMNSVQYNEKLDQILVSCNWLSEIWIIDHSTTTEEAAGHTGGQCGRGGDLLYRWGNPQTYLRHEFAHLRHFWGQHDARWVPDNHPGEGNILVFSNGSLGKKRRFSSVDEIEPPLLSDGTYAYRHGEPFEPQRPVWSFADPKRMFSGRISGSQRLPNGHTLICSGMQGLVVEVTAEGKAVWAFRNPPRLDPTDNSATGKEFDEEQFFAEQDFGSEDEAESHDEDKPKDSKPTVRPVWQALLRGARNRIGIPPDGGGTLFRAPRYPPDYPAFRGRDLTPLTPDGEDSDSEATSEEGAEAAVVPQEATSSGSGK